MCASVESDHHDLDSLRRHVQQLEREVQQARSAEIASRSREQKLATHNLVLVGLSRTHAIEQGDVGPAMQQICVAAAHTLEVERVSVWLFSEDRSRIRCLDIYERTRNAHSHGLELLASDYPSYFRAVEENRTIAADDARADHRTSEFDVNYLQPLGITSMLDAPVRVGGRLVGIICHEHVGPRRQWTLEDQAFAGSMADFVAMTIQADERRRAQDAVRDSERKLRQIIDLVPHLIFVKDRHGRFLLANQAAAEFSGTTVDAIVGHNVREVHPSLEEATSMMAEDLEVIDSGRAKVIADAPLTDSRGQSRVFLKTKVPFRVAGSSERAILGVAIDITERNQFEQRQDQMIQELDHRVKNTLAQVAAIAEQTAIAASGLAPFLETFLGRIHALGKAHELLAAARWDGAELRDLLEKIVLPHLVEADRARRITFRGPRLVLPVSIAPTVSLILHELALNAVKHGALRCSTGSIEITWRVDSDSGSPRLKFIWAERCPTASSSPQCRGFGTSFIERAVTHQLRGKVALDFRTDGLLCELDLPLRASVTNADEPGDEMPEAAESPLVELPLRDTPRNGLRVLVVEDDTLVAQSLELMLARLGCHVIGPVSTPEDACKCVRDSQPDAAILDINLSPGTSAPIARSLRMRGLPFTFVTGYSSIKMLPEELRGHCVLTKPITQDTLGTAVREMSRARTARR
jgi:PAS domain S-box-containing protein